MHAELMPIAWHPRRFGLLQPEDEKKEMQPIFIEQ